MKIYFIDNIAKQLKSNKLFLLSCVILFFWICIALLPLLWPKLCVTPIDLSHRLCGPSKNFLLGTDGNGQSIALLMINGAAISLLVSIFTLAMSLIVGIPLGAIAGFFGGKIDLLISAIIDILLAFPPLILPITIMAFFGGGLLHIVFALSITGWLSYARMIRGQFLVYKNKEFVLAAYALGARPMHIIFKHILPHSLAPVIIQGAFSIAGVIIAEAGLSFLGLSSNQDHISWGTLLSDAKDYLSTNPMLVLFPSIALCSIVASLNFIADTLKVDIQ